MKIHVCKKVTRTVALFEQSCLLDLNVRQEKARGLQIPIICILYILFLYI